MTTFKADRCVILVQVTICAYEKKFGDGVLFTLILGSWGKNKEKEYGVLKFDGFTFSFKFTLWFYSALDVNTAPVAKLEMPLTRPRFDQQHCRKSEEKFQMGELN